MLKRKKKESGPEPIRVHSPSSKVTLQHAQRHQPRQRITNHDLNEFDLWQLEKSNGDHPSWWPLLLVLGFVALVKGLQGFSVYNRLREGLWPYIVDWWITIESFWISLTSAFS